MSSGTASPKRSRERRLPRQTLPCRLVIRMRPDLDNLVLGSGISQSLDRYCDSVVMPLLVIVPAALVVAGFALALPHGLYMAVLVAALLAIMGFLLSLALSGVIPAFRFSSRSDAMEAKFHAFASTLALLLAGGREVHEALLGLYDYRDELKEFSVEIDYLHKSLSLGGDPSKVLRRLSEITPSRSVKVLAESLAKAVETGSDPLSVVRYQLETYINYYYSLVDRVSATVGSLLEMFLAVGLILPILVTIAALLFAAYAVKGLSPMSLVTLAVFIILPIVSMMTVVLVDNQMSKLKL
ncbi:MAG: type II secretion system F family protein [Acidianus sp.]|nr:type II secretion system F family protein [Acidianus sp.]